MKTDHEIREKIEDLIKKAFRKPDGAEKERIMCNIDALLWVIDDQSGKPI